MNIKKIKKIMLKEKEDELFRYQVLEEYLIERITKFQEKDRRDTLNDVQKTIQELQNQIEYLKK